MMSDSWRIRISLAHVNTVSLSSLLAEDFVSYINEKIEVIRIEFPQSPPILFIQLLASLPLYSVFLFITTDCISILLSKTKLSSGYWIPSQLCYLKELYQISSLFYTINFPPTLSFPSVNKHVIMSRI